ncbi:MAG: acyl-CoA thioesterase/BAAT N-terminal domain-containing protein [Halobacterium sp.]
MPADAPADSTAAPTIHAPADAAVDDAIRISVTGLDPGERVTLEATFADLGTEWASDATFEADADGRVDLTEDEPVAGDYDGLYPMGLVQFADRVGESPVDTRDGRETTDLKLAARVDGDVVAETTVRRRVAPNVDARDLDPQTDGVAGTLYAPGEDGSHQGVVALHGSGGEPYGRKARVLASHGFAVLALRYFGGPDPVPEEFAEVPISYVGDAIARLRDCEAVATGDVGVVGASRGSELAALTASQRDDVGVVVAYAPSAFAWFGEDADDEPGPPPSAWTVDGDPLPLLPHPGRGGQPEETDRGLRTRPMYEAFVREADADALEEAMLPVGDVAADVVLVSGRDDGIWQASEMSETLVDAMQDAPGAAAHYAFEDAGHGVFLPYHPTTERSTREKRGEPDFVHGGTPSGAATADEESWRVALDALETLRE